MEDQKKCSHAVVEKSVDRKWYCVDCGLEFFALTVFDGGKIQFHPMPEVGTLRDQLAMAALVGVATSSRIDTGDYRSAIAADCYAMADAMLEASKA